MSMKSAVTLVFSFIFQATVWGAVTLDAKDGDSVMLESDPAMKNIGKPKKGSPAAAAITAFQDGEYEEGVALATPLAAAGNADAIYLLGFAHETGQGAKLSPQKAAEYYEKSLLKGHADSIYRLSLLLMVSENQADLRRAQEILEERAIEDPMVAGRILGEAFLRGLLTENPAPESAISWWKKAAEAGDIASMNFLARFYEGQMGFPEKTDAAQALEFYRSAANEGDSSAMVNLASRLLAGDKKLRDEKKGREWIAKAIAVKEPAAYLALGDYFEKEKKDLKSALAEYRKGAEADQVDSMLRAGILLAKGGEGIEKDNKRGTELLKKAAEAGSAQAHLELAGMLLNKENPDVTGGYTYLLTAANGGLPFAQNELGILYLSGKLGAADVSAGLSWFGRAAQANFAPAQNNLAALHERGAGVPQNFENAIKLYALAAQQGHPGATLALARFHSVGAGIKQNKELAWALAKIAEEHGETNAAEFITEIEKSLTKEQLASAKKQLEKLKSGEKVE